MHHKTSNLNCGNPEAHSFKSKLSRLFKQAITYVVLASLQLGTLVQTKEAYAQYVQYGGQPTNGQAVNGQPNYGYVPPTAGAQTGYSNDGTLFMGGQRIGNPHQILHDVQIPSFMNITATRYTFTNDPTHGQGTLAQMELATTNGSDSSVLLNRLYLSPTNPYVQGAPGPYPNYQTYQGVLQNAQQANYLLTNADDGKTYAFKTLTAANRQAVDLLIRELPNTSQFKAAADPLGGGTGVRVTQNGDAVALAAYLATVKPYDYSWQPNFGTTFGQNGQNNPAFSGWANSNNFAPDYSEGAGPAQSFQAFIKQLQDDAVANDKKVRSQTSANSLDFSGVNPNSLFGEGYNLFQYASNSNPNRDLENDFLRRLQSGQLTAGSADYLEASRIAQERYRIAYATRLETGKPLQFTVAQAQQKANELKLDAINPNELFGQGFDLFKYNSALRANGEAENVLLARLQNGELTPGSADYLQATQIAQERLRIAYSQSLVPPEPKKVAKWKLIAGIVVGAVLTFVTAGALAPFVLSALTGATVAGATALIAGGFVAGTAIGAVTTAVAGIVAGAIGAIASTTITTGSLSEGLKAGGKALVSGSVKAIVGAAIGFSFASLDLLGTAGTITETVSNIAVNTLSGAVSSTILGGGSFADNLKTSAISSVVDAVGKSAANAIGDAFPNSGGTNVANYAAHAVLGCATAAAKGGDCASGAIGAAAGEVAAATGFVNWAAAGMGQTLTDNGTVFFSGLIGGTVAAAVGSGDKVESNFATGTATATNAVTNNYLNHTEQALKEKALKECAGNSTCEKGVKATWDSYSQAKDENLKASCLKDTAQCSANVQRMEQDLAEMLKNKDPSKGTIGFTPEESTNMKVLMADMKTNIYEIARAANEKAGVGAWSMDYTPKELLDKGLISNADFGTLDRIQRNAAVEIVAAAAMGVAGVVGKLPTGNLGGKVVAEEGAVAGTLSGKPTTIPPLSDAATTRSLIRENESAVNLSKNGYAVEQNPVVAGTNSKPDYKVNGEVFDNYAPSTSNVRNAASEIQGKIDKGQTSNVVVNLTDSKITPDQLQSQLRTYPIPGLKQVIVIDQAGKIVVVNLAK